MEWLANLYSHIPNGVMEIVICYGFCNTVIDYSLNGNLYFSADPTYEEL
jgi:hypothetical protein